MPTDLAVETASPRFLAFKIAQTKAFSSGGAAFYVDVSDAVKANVASDHETTGGVNRRASGKGLTPISGAILSGERTISANGALAPTASRRNQCRQPASTSNQRRAA